MVIFPIDKEFKHNYFLTKPKIGRRFVITDIHGFINTFKELLKRINFNKNDQLFILGDMIDKGKKGHEILDMIIDFIDNRYAVFPVLGNHEDMYLKSHSRNHDAETLQIPVLKRSKYIRDKFRKIYPRYLRLFEKLPYYYELDDFYLVHAGFNFKAENPFQDYESMIWINEFAVKDKITKGKTVIHGHKNTPLEDIVKSIENKSNKINLDNGTTHINSKKFGNMVCLNIDTYELFIQKNIDKK